jgi:hypothetical protein
LIADLAETLLFLTFSYYLRQYQDKLGTFRFYPVAVKDMNPILDLIKRRVTNEYETTINMSYRITVVNSLSASDAFNMLAGMLAINRDELMKRARICPELLNVLNQMSFLINYTYPRLPVLSWKRNK